MGRALTKLLRKDSFRWSPEAEEAFRKLKEAMSSAPVLALVNMNETFTVETDSSNTGIGVVLSQRNRPVAFIDKTLSQKQQSLSADKKELFAIKQWHYYLLNRHFIIKTDHRSLKFLLEQKLSTPLQHTWLAKLLGYDYEILYRKGAYNKAADALSCVQGTTLFAMALSSVST